MDIMVTSMTDEMVELCEQYKSAVTKSDLERRIFDCFNAKHQGRLEYSILVEKLRSLEVYDLMQKAQNVYLGALVSEFLKEAMHKGVENIANEYVKLNALCSTSDCSYLYSHYIKTCLSLSGDDFFIKKPDFANDCIEKALKNSGWEHKKNLYYSVIDQIVKFDNRRTKSSVVMISNQPEDYFLKYLSELRSQSNHQDYKIIFVSNCSSNQTDNVLNNVDIFIQLSDNYGDCMPRNVGALFSNSDIVVFIEDDGMPDKGFVQAHQNIHDRQDVFSLRGCYLPITNGGMPAHYWLGMHERIAPPILEGNCSFDLEAFYRVGGWGDYLFFGHGGYEICYRMLEAFSQPEQHIYSPVPVLFHDWLKAGDLLERKQLRHHALWHLLRSRHPEFYKLPKIFGF